MADNLNVFVKGRKGKYAFEIKNKKGKQLYIELKEDIFDKSGIHMWQNNTDYEAILASLKYISVNRGKNNLPLDPAISIYTSNENNYHVINGIKKAQKDNVKGYLSAIQAYKQSLRKYGAKDETVKIFFAPNHFTHHFDNLAELFEHSKLSLR